MALVARLGDTIDHGGSITSSASLTTVDGILVARVGDEVTCEIHGKTVIVDGSGNYNSEGKITAVVGSSCYCGAKINSGSGVTNAPLESPRNAIKLGSGSLDNQNAVMG
jgi:uncharacterized Zn-binding protein involved in type VI secretion